MNNKRISKPQKQISHHIKVIHNKIKTVNPPPLKNKKCRERMLGKS